MADVNLWAVAGGVAIYAGGLGTELLRGVLTRSASRTEREDARTQQRQDRREDFEVAALLELQEVILVMARQVGVGIVSDDTHFRATGSWRRGAPLLPDEAGGEASLVAGRTFLKLKPRIPSAELRTVLEAFHYSCTEVTLSPPGDGHNDQAMHDEGMRRAAAMTDRLVAAQDAIDARIRDLYAT
ncbi:hypothetical protein [Aeromicrobium fastidiosum]|uniref:Uncharacterized protein n=1 Tax=Aeromicrobium fastidiosum TaxID=52699 RepID=A0A641AS39_9ACTN|nr:hypothetical protein [Aeromicrobium fastidiosum]KAA1379871.1 hypothetical protein ESP62_001270 [Aeromicrobium fastidiosum]MBP2389374.1 hypothetical protein [Aeromicrobium fastidiosum]